MAIKVTSKTFARIRHTGKTQPKVDVGSLAAALGAETSPLAQFSAPHELAQLANQLTDRLESQGGRPSLRGAELRQKIPFLAEDWSSIEAIAKRLSRPGRRVSAGQVASALVHEKLQELSHKH